MFLIKNGTLYDAMPISKQTASFFFFFFLREETVQIGGKEVRSLADANWKSVYPTVFFYFCSRKLCKSAEKRWDLSPTSTGSPSTRRSGFFIFARGNCANRRKRSEISRRRLLEVCLPDVKPIRYSMIGPWHIQKLCHCNEWDFGKINLCNCWSSHFIFYFYFYWKKLSWLNKKWHSDISPVPFFPQDEVQRR